MMFYVNYKPVRFNHRKKYGDWALIAGAAGGLGATYCTLLASRGFNIIMIDKNEELLKKLSDELAGKFTIQTMPLFIDLFKESSVKEIMNAIADIDCRLLIYNAAFRYIKNFTEHTSDELDNYLNVNINSQIKLIHAFAKNLISKNQRGGILLMSSLAGLLGMQLVATYSASKAFTWNLAEALYHEFKPHNIDITACIAGPIDTEAFLGSNPKYGFIRPQVQRQEAVAKAALKKLGKRAFFISGWSNRVNYFILTKLLPRKLASGIANNTMGNMYADTSC